MATITPRKNKDGILTSFTIRVFMGIDSSGKKLYETTSMTCDPKWSEKHARKEAEKYSAVFEKEIKEGTISNDRQRFDQYCDYVLELKASTGVKASTIERYKGLKDRIFPAIGHLKLKDITAKHLNQFYLNLLNNDTNRVNGKPLSPHTVKHYHELISSVLEQAFRENLILFNPARQATLPKVITKEPEILEPDQIAKVIEVLENESIKWKTLITLLINSGIRRGEALGLKWENVDFSSNTIRICNNVIQSKEKGIYEDTPKTKTSIRTIGLPPTAMSILKDYKVWQMEERIRLGSYFENRDFVFTQDNGNSMSPDSVSHYCRVSLSKKCGFSIHPHMFRHTQASLLIAKGMPPTSVSKRLGHAQVSTTLNIYSHALKDADQDNVAVLEQILYSK